MIEIKNDCSAFIEIFSSTTGDSNDFKVFITNNNNNDDVFIIDINQNHYYERKSKLLIKKKKRKISFVIMNIIITSITNGKK